MQWWLLRENWKGACCVWVEKICKIERYKAEDDEEKWIGLEIFVYEFLDEFMSGVIYSV